MRRDGFEREKRAMRPNFDVAEYIAERETHPLFRTFIIDANTLDAASDEIWIKNPRAEVNPTAALEIHQQVLDNEKLASEIPENLNEIVLKELVGESVQKNNLLLELAARSIMRDSGVIVVVNVMSPKKFGLPASNIHGNGLERLAFIHPRMGERKDFELARRTFGDKDDEGNYWSHPNGFVAFLHHRAPSPEPTSS